MTKPYSAVARIQPSEHPRWCVVTPAHSREDCRPDEADSQRMCRIPGCLRERFDNWSTCEVHESRGSRLFDRF